MNDENLKPFPKGVSGNPAGRPKGVKNISHYLKKISKKRIEVKDPITKKLMKKEIAEAVALKIIQLALAGELYAIREMLDRTEGKAIQKQELKFDKGIKKFEVEYVN